MDSQYRLLSILFSLKSAVDPFVIIQDIERYLKKKKCVVYVKAFRNDLIVCTICGDSAISKVKNKKKVLINKSYYNYKAVEMNVTSLKIEVPYGVGKDDINRLLRPYGTVIKSEIYINEEIHVYYGIIELKRNMPARLKCKYGSIYAVEII
ncbi:hypothetical protein HNY73_017687 [Argiope bruennichi]|uniref:Uncharacterized protein n=1 Tax=Argiope bruennichi TaxID=94029 RepID=A0A8T0EBI1_ARGBR|nr:hypothetical protein HNY73_017687 [Argiope bruennichi]